LRLCRFVFAKADRLFYSVFYSQHLAIPADFAEPVTLTADPCGGSRATAKLQQRPNPDKPCAQRLRESRPLVRRKFGETVQLHQLDCFARLVPQVSRGVLGDCSCQAPAEQAPAA
jgi:hypothetical protein